MRRTSLQDCISLGKNKDINNNSLYVVIDSERNGGNRAGSFNIAYEGGFLEHIGDTFYKCKRIVADNLSLVILSDYPITM
jgi:hypothetical protein